MSLIPRDFLAGTPSLFGTQDFFSPFSGWPFDTSSALSTRQQDWPTRQMAVDVVERDNEWEVKADVPGVNKDDIKVTVDKDVLRINVQKSEEKKEEKEGEGGTKYHRYERSSSFVGRAMRMPENANLDEIKARFENGTLHLTMPKTERKEAAKQITVD